MRTKKGIIGSTKMTGTVSVEVSRKLFHPVYKKRFKRSSKFLADNNGFDLHEGDTVEITECKPISKNKYFKVTKIINSVARVSEVDDSKDAELAERREKQAPVEEKKEEKKEETEAKETNEETTTEEDTDSPSAK